MMSLSQKIETGPGRDHVRIMHSEDGSIIHGQRGVDILEGNGGNDIIYDGKSDGYRFDDVSRIDGGAGDDTLYIQGFGNSFEGGPGADLFVVEGGVFFDIVDFTPGEDLIDLRSLAGTDDVYGFEDLGMVGWLNDGIHIAMGGFRAFLLNMNGHSLSASDFVFANPVDGATAGNDDLRGTWGHDFIDGGDGNDQLIGLRGNDILEGGDGNDRLFGYAGEDNLRGGAGNDSLWGGKGRDVLNGGEGDDWLRGNQGADIFRFSWNRGEVDVIDDFTDGEDLIDLQLFRLAGLSDVRATQDGDDVRIGWAEPEKGYGTVVLENFDIADLDAGDFLF